MSSSKRENKPQERAIDESIDVTKESANKMLQEAKRDLPEVTSTFHDYQEQNIRGIRDITNTFLESQKEVAKSMQSALKPQGANPYIWMFLPWMHPEIATENYVRAVASFTESSLAAAKTSSELVQIAMESERSSIDIARNNTKILSRYFVETAKGFEDASLDSNEKSKRHGSA